MKIRAMKQAGDGQTAAVVSEISMYIVDQTEPGMYKLNEAFHHAGNTANYEQVNGVYPAAELCKRINKQCSGGSDAFTVLIEYDDLKKILAAGTGGTDEE